MRNNLILLDTERTITRSGVMVRGLELAQCVVCDDVCVTGFGGTPAA